MPISVHDWGGWRKGGWQQLSTVLAYYAVRVNYNLTSGRAIAVLLIPFALLMLLMLCVGLAVGMLVINAS